MSDTPDPTASRVVWALVYLGLGTLIIANLPPDNAGRYLIAAGVSYGVAAWFLFLLLVRRT